MSTLELIDYSERAIAVFGDTKLYLESFHALGGKYNPSLKYKEDARSPGWVFPKTKRDAVEAVLNDISTGKIKKAPVTEKKTSSYKGPTSSHGDKDTVDRKAFLALASRVEKLEQDLAMLMANGNAKKTAVKTAPANIPDIVFEGDDEGDDDEEPEVKPRLLARPDKNK